MLSQQLLAGLPSEAVRAIPDQEDKHDGRGLRAVGRLKDDIIHSLSSVLAKARRMTKGEELSQEGRAGGRGKAETGGGANP